MGDPIKRTEFRKLSEDEFLKRLKFLLPKNSVSNSKLTITKTAIEDATILTEEIAKEIINTLASMPDLDVVYDLRDASLNIACLGRFLNIAFNKILENP